MHRQIAAIAATVQARPQKAVAFEMNAGEQTALGRILFLMYYRTGIMDLIRDHKTHGYPHNGGQHTFYFVGPRREAVTFLELLKEELEQPKYRLNEEERQVLSELSFISQDILSLR